MRRAPVSISSSGRARDNPSTEAGVQTKSSSPQSKKQRISQVACMSVRVLSLCSFFWVARLGCLSFVQPWASYANPDAAASIVYGGALYVTQYFLESLIAMGGRVTMHTWRAYEVVTHHLTVGLVVLPVAVRPVAVRHTGPRSGLRQSKRILQQ